MWVMLKVCVIRSVSVLVLVYSFVDDSSGPVRIVVETRRERGDRPPSRPRGGAPVNGEARGGFGGPGRGRGTGRGARGGAVAK